jgi:ATP phosphoribosyltransferase
VRIGVACDEAPVTAVAALLAEAGLPASRLTSTASPALLPGVPDQWLLAPGADVLGCCERGAVDVAVVGKDLLLELEPALPELLDLRVCRDRLVYAVAPGGRRPRPRVATRYPRLTRRHFDETGRQIETVALGPAAALTPALGAADGVVELESRLARLPQQLSVEEEVAPCTARLVASRAARVLDAERLADLVTRLRAIVEGAR